MTLSLIAAIDLNNAIGLDGDQLIYISQDLRHFKEVTMGCPVIMGRKTNLALPKRCLPGRRNIVLSRSLSYAPQAEGVEVVHSADEALRLVASEPRVFVIGGEQVYRVFMPMADELVLTVIHESFPKADAFFPAINGWKSVYRSEIYVDPRSGVSFHYETFARA